MKRYQHSVALTGHPSPKKVRFTKKQRAQMYSLRTASLKGYKRSRVYLELVYRPKAQRQQTTKITRAIQSVLSKRI